jgi:hypothetical protein
MLGDATLLWLTRISTLPSTGEQRMLFLFFLFSFSLPWTETRC